MWFVIHPVIRLKVCPDRHSVGRLIQSICLHKKINIGFYLIIYKHINEQTIDVDWIVSCDDFLMTHEQISKLQQFIVKL